MNYVTNYDITMENCLKTFGHFESSLYSSIQVNACFIPELNQHAQKI